MRSVRPRPLRVLAMLLAVASCAAAPRANAQSPSLTGPPATEAARPADPEARAPLTGEPAVVEQAPAEGPQPYRPPSYPKTLLLDAGHVLTAPIRWQGRDWLLFSASAAGLAVLSLADESLSDAARERGSTLGFVGDTAEGLGDARALVLLGGFYLAGVIGRDSKAKNVCLDGLSAVLIANGVITPVLSTLIGRERPTEEQGAYSFHPFEGRSFPSGHATQAFAVASVIATSYDQTWVKVTAYSVAAVTGYIRVMRGKHFPTDVVAGALIGTAVGRSVVHFNRKLRSGEKEPETQGARLTVLPLVSGEGFGVSATLVF